MSQLWSNNVDTTLSASLSDVAVTAELTDVAGLPTPTSGDFLLLTLQDGGNTEIVSMTARTGNTVTITRAQEGTTARSWAASTRCFAGITAGTLTDIADAAGSSTAGTGANSVQIGPTSDASGASSVAIGHEAIATSTATEGIAIGRWAETRGDDSIAIGDNAFARENTSIAFGPSATADALRTIAIGNATAEAADSIAIGDDAWTDASGGISIGKTAQNNSADAVVVGSNASAPWGYDGSIALGHGAMIEAPNAMHCRAIPTVPRHTGVGSLSFSAADVYYKSVSAEAVVVSEIISLTSTITHTLTLPANTTFYPDEVGLIVTAADTVTGQPTVRFGETGAEAIYVAAVATTGLDAVRARQRFTSLLTGKGTTAPRFEITIAGAATSLVARVYWRGFLVRDQ